MLLLALCKNGLNFHLLCLLGAGTLFFCFRQLRGLSSPVWEANAKGRHVVGAELCRVCALPFVLHIEIRAKFLLRQFHLSFLPAHHFRAATYIRISVCCLLQTFT